ncbi:PDZ domain-containing protein [Phragmitibacter flavus]|uniref:PDZ domain-containing protein n=1 Tax=Phragmitibacter flavus TaxID=2576071 RepID=A0A5R8K7J2_9BACT|nr:S41 family peptidase [Phragmitibacter flavus]TLD68328.1 PDZ domain-containing protein [Phragmitibacter flavus]
MTSTSSFPIPSAVLNLLRRSASHLLACGLWLSFSSSASLAQQPEAQSDQDLAAVTKLVQEVVDKLDEHALHPQPKPVIYQKAWLGLLLEMGRSELAAEHDFTVMSSAQSLKTFISAINELAKAPGQRRSLRELAESALQRYCRQHDPYTRYTRSEEYHQINLLNKGKGSQVGMSIHEKDGSYFCYPMPQSPAEVAGIKAGDRLISVDGRAIDGRPLLYIASLIKGGAPGSKVALRVEHRFGRAESITVTRETLEMPSVTVEKKITGFVLRVRRFDDDLLEVTRKALASLKPSSTLTIDLRGCAGGKVSVAVGFAELFLNSGEEVVRLRMRDASDEIFKATKAPEFKAAAIILLQDEGTASAAEMVIAALINTKAQRATSQGSKTFGKGVVLTSLELKGGGSLLVTSSEMIAPQGRGWDGIGLLPSLENNGKIFPEAGLP